LLAKPQPAGAAEIGQTDFEKAVGEGQFKFKEIKKLKAYQA